MAKNKADSESEFKALGEMVAALMALEIKSADDEAKLREFVRVHLWTDEERAREREPGRVFKIAPYVKRLGSVRVILFAIKYALFDNAEDYWQAIQCAANVTFKNPSASAIEKLRAGIVHEVDLTLRLMRAIPKNDSLSLGCANCAKDAARIIRPCVECAKDIPAYIDRCQLREAESLIKSLRRYERAFRKNKLKTGAVRDLLVNPGTSKAKGVAALLSMNVNAFGDADALEKDVAQRFRDAAKKYPYPDDLDARAAKPKNEDTTPKSKQPKPAKRAPRRRT